LRWTREVLVLALTAAGCAKKPPPKTPPTPEAGFVVMAAQAVPLEVELSGRTSAYETADVRPQVSGVIRARRFEEGSVVRQGQTLYEIDPSLYQAAAGQAAANVAAAKASRSAAEARAARYKPLVAIEAVSKQDYSDALAQAQQLDAQVKQASAALQTANINLRFTRVPAPISGRIGRSTVTTGALVTNGQPAAMATIQRLDPIFVDIQQSSADVLALRQQMARGGVAPAASPVRLTLEDGSPYPLQGQIQFSEALVDPSTGAVTLRARFPNPDNVLLPGMFVRAKLVQAVASSAILAPQRAVTRDPQGQATVLLVGPGNRAVAQAIKVSRTVGDNWLVVSGLKPGDKVITEGLIKVRPGQPIRPVPAGSRPQGGGGKGRPSGEARGGAGPA
jgi:membrane fusion protein (multidrug efflux system)